MADALCGPVNPLASFQKHTQVDRTLQQDRLTGPRQSPPQGFRTPDPRAGSLDAEFAAFEAGPANSLQFQQPFQPPPFHALQAPSLSNWAADFQKLRVSDQPIPSHQFRTEAPILRSGLGGWQNEFLNQRQNGATPVSLGKQPEREVHMAPPPSSWSAHQSGYLEQPMFQSYQPGPMLFQEHIHDEQQPLHMNSDHLQISDADFEAAFSEAQEEIQQMEMDIPEESLDRMAEAEAQRFFADNQLLHSDGTYTNDHSEINTDRPGLSDSSLRIGSDAINYTEQKDRTAEQDTRDADDLARTAGQLLNSVQYDNSDKFRESRFLDLMRRIRDRETVVKGEDFVDTARDLNERDLNAITTKDTTQRPSTFTFPDLNEVYNPRFTDGKTEADYHFDTHSTPASHTPRSQIQELHPGGRYYPEQSPPPGDHTMMSGGINTSYQPPSVEDA